MSAPVESQHHDFELLARKLLTFAPYSGRFVLSVPGLRCARRDMPAQGEPELFPPCIFVPVQGSLRVALNGEEIVLNPGEYLLNCVDMHTVFSAEPSADAPFLALALDVDSSLFLDMFREIDGAEAKSSADESSGDAETGGHAVSGLDRGIRVSAIPAELLDALLRLVATDGDEGRVRVVAPLIIREIYYYLVSGEHGAYLRAFYASSAQSSQIARAIAYMREHCYERLRIETLARLANMAESTFNRNFRRITTFSPLQYHKNLKLHEARRLMMTENMSAAAACSTVGYESQQQFTREYKRLFGCPPMKDVRRSQ